MNDIYEGYLSPKERKEAIVEAKLNTLFERCNMMLEMVQLRYEQNVREAELKVLVEGGTYDDLTYFIEEAGDEAADKKKGIIATLIDTILNLCKTIVDSIRSLFIKDDVETVQVDENIMNSVNIIDQGHQVLQQIFSGGIVSTFLRGVAIAEGFNKFLGLVKSIPSTAGQVKTYTADAVNKAKDKLIAVCDWISDHTADKEEELKNASAEQVNRKEGNIGIDFILNGVKNFQNLIRKTINRLFTALGDKLKGKNKTKEDDKENADKSENKDEKSADKPAEGEAENKDNTPDNSSGGSSGTPDNSSSGTNGTPKNDSTQNTSNNGKISLDQLSPDDRAKYDKLLAEYNTHKTKGKKNKQRKQSRSALNNFIINHNLDMQTYKESVLDDYIDDINSNIYENTMSDYEYDSIVSAIDALF